jgi:parallel beta-helix repeat protein
MCVAALALVPALALAAGIVIHVPGDAPTIQAGINAAQAADTVLVACGTYYEHDIEMKSGVCLMSATSDPACVTIDAENQGSCILCDGVDDYASITGFTLTHGRSAWGGGIYGVASAVPIRNCRFVYNSASASGGGGVYWCEGVVDIAGCLFEDNTAVEGAWQGGGGLALRQVSGTVARCTFRNNWAGVAGGGMACWNQVSATIDSCTFFENTASDLVFSEGYGGGVYCENEASPAFWNCTFYGNTAGNSGGGVYIEDDSSPSFSGCTFEGNHSDWGGGGYIEHCSSLWFVDCWFHDNSARDGGGFYAYETTSLTFTQVIFQENSVSEGGGGLTCDFGTTVSTGDCTFDRNVAAWGGGVAVYVGELTMDGCTVASNDTTDVGAEDGAVYIWAGSAQLNNCVVAFNTTGGAIVCTDGGSVALTCTDIFGNVGGDWVDCAAAYDGLEGNISADPRFCGLVTGNYELCTNSPCLPANNDCAVLMGAHGSGCGNCDSAVEATSWGAIKAMYR